MATIDTILNLPDMALESSSGVINLAHYPHDWLVLYFYPKDATAGCTTQANEFSQLQAEFTALNTQIIGVSRDSLKSHQRFIEKQTITFPLISDPQEELCRYFDVIKEKNMYGKKVLGIERSCFIFHQGKCVEAWRKVKAAGNAQMVLDKIKTYQNKS